MNRWLLISLLVCVIGVVIGYCRQVPDLPAAGNLYSPKDELNQLNGQ